MPVPLEHEIEAAMAELRQAQARISEINRQMEAERTSVRSKDRMIEATVDARGRLTALSLNGTRYRELSPKDLAARIIETVQAAQDKGGRAVMARMAGLAPTGVPVEELFSGTLSLEAMLEAAVAEVRDPGFGVASSEPKPTAPQRGAVNRRG